MKNIQFTELSLLALVMGFNFLSKATAFVPTFRYLNRIKSGRSNLYLGPNDDSMEEGETKLERRTFLNILPAASLSLLSWANAGTNIPKAQARGLVKFPCKGYQFLNTYHFVRAGESLLEEEGVWSTNPLFLTNQESALSPNGIEQMEQVCEKCREKDITPSIVRYSLAASAIDSSNIIGKTLKVGRDRLVPEFNFMDPRAIGSWDMSSFNSTQDAVWAMDYDEAGNDGMGGRPPSNEDGTPHETLSDQVVRLQQMLSVLETQYSGDTVVLVFPDGTGPALLTCLIGGIPLNRVHELEYSSGEVRFDINYDSAHSYLSQQPSEEYVQAIARGRSQLKSLRENPEEVQNVRDLEYSKQLRRDEEKKAQEAREEAKRKLEMEKAKAQQREEQKKAKLAAARDEEKRAKLTTERERNAESIPSKELSPQTETTLIDTDMLTIGGLAMISAIGAGKLLGGEEIADEDEEKVSADLSKLSQNTTVSESKSSTSASNHVSTDTDVDMPDPISKSNETSEEIPIEASNSKLREDHQSARAINLSQNSTTNEQTSNIGSDTSLAPIIEEPVVATMTLEPPGQAWDPNEDDGGLAWLGSLSDLMSEDEDSDGED